MANKTKLSLWTCLGTIGLYFYASSIGALIKDPLAVLVHNLIVGIGALIFFINYYFYEKKKIKLEYLNNGNKY